MGVHETLIREDSVLNKHATVLADTEDGDCQDPSDGIEADQTAKHGVPEHSYGVSNRENNNQDVWKQENYDDDDG